MKRSILGLVVLLMLPLTGSRASDVVRSGSNRRRASTSIGR